MCQAYILRFSCHHGLLMSVNLCKIGPCPFLKTCGGPKLSQQPYRCFKCQQRRESQNMPKSPSRLSSCTSTISSFESNSSTSSGRPKSPLARTVTAPLPGVALQPTGTLQYCTTSPSRPRSMSSRSFSFSCNSSNHYLTEHYLGLPGFLPHQDHPCPPCQIESYRDTGDREATAQAKAEFPHLTGEMLVRNGRIREDWQSNLTLEKYVEEKRTDERQMWLHVVRKWTQDLKKVRVLVSEEDGLGLFA